MKNPLAHLGTLNSVGAQTVSNFKKSSEDRDLLKRMKKTATYAGKTIKSFKVA